MYASSGELLCKAARDGDLSKVQKYLSKENCKVNYVTRQFKSALYEAMDNGNTDIVKELLNHKDIDPNLGWKIKKLTPLMFASKNGKSVYVKLLLAHEKVDLTLKDKDGKTAEDYARSKTIIKLLEQHK